MSANFIVNTPKSRMHALAHQGIMAADCFSQIRDMLRRRFDDDYVLLFAEPVPNDADASIDWYTPVQGAVQPLTDLPEEEQNLLRDKLAQMASDIRRHAEELKQSPDSERATRGAILLLALAYPGEEALFVAGGQPVFTCWGYGPGTPGAEAQDLSRLARLVRTAPVAAAFAPPPAAPPPEPPPESRKPVPVPVPPPQGQGGGRGCLFWALWLLPLLLLLLLILLPFIGIGGVPALSGRTLYNIPYELPAHDLEALRTRNESLERDIAALNARLKTQAARCGETPPAPAAPPAPPEEPRGEELVIPEAPTGMSFLRGRWLCETGLVNDDNEPVVVEFTFDEQGRGQATVFEKDQRDRCVGKAEASMSEAGLLRIEVEQQRCGRGGAYSQQKIDCRNSPAGTSAECSGTNRTGGWNARFFRMN